LLELSLQVVLVVLLACSIGWSMLLHRRLASMRRGGDEIGRFVLELTGATARAETATRQMREASAEMSRQWQRQRSESEQLAGELRRASADADQLLHGVREASAQACATRPGAASGPAAMGAYEPDQSAADDHDRHERIRRAIRDLR
jgi:hypothetical protein